MSDKNWGMAKSSSGKFATYSRPSTGNKMVTENKGASYVPSIGASEKKAVTKKLLKD